MDIQYRYPHEPLLTPAVVVVDVLRAFTTAAFAFAGGCPEIVLVGSIEEALRLKAERPGTRTMGEGHGVKVPEFDYGNSPAQFAGEKLQGVTLIQRTTAGTQGVIACSEAEEVLAGSFVCAEATARLLRLGQAHSVSFLITGRHSGADGDEDLAFAEYCARRLNDEPTVFEPYAARVRKSSWGRQFTDGKRPELTKEDLALCLELDRFNFAMRVTRQGDLAVLRPCVP